MPTAEGSSLASDQILMSVLEKTYRGELKQLITSVRFQNPAAVTLTLRKRCGQQAVDAMIASKNFHLFRTRLETRVLGRAAKKHGKRLPIIAVLEMSADHRLHYHCIIDRPYHCSFERFSAIIRDQWSKTDFGYHQVDIQDQFNDGWTDYLLKRRQKSALLDSIDWTNCHFD